MNHTRKRNLIGAAFVLALGAVAAAPAVHVPVPLAKDAFKAAQQRIEQQAKAEHKACERFKGNAKDQCNAQAKAHEQVARARLDAQRKPGLEAEKLAKFKEADALYDAARVRCDAQPKGYARDRCMDQAKTAHEAAIRLAKVQKVEEQNALKAREEQAKKQLANAQHPQAQQHAEKARPLPPKS